MIIRRKEYKRLLYRIGELEKAIEELDEETALNTEDISSIKSAIPAFRETIDGKLFAFSEDIGGILGKLSDFEERLTPLEDETEEILKSREVEKAFLDGVANIMNFGASYGEAK